MDAHTTKLIQQLIDVGSGNVNHLYRGQCPDAVAGYKVRDNGCPACKVLIEAALVAFGVGLIIT